VALAVLIALFAFFVLGTLVLRLLGLFLLLRPPLLEILFVGGALERDRLAVPRRDEMDLRAFLLLVLLGSAHEGDPAAVRRPAGRRVVGTAGERPRRR